MSEARGEVLMRPYLDTPDRKTAVPEVLEESMRLTSSRVRCGECGEYFRSVSAFDAHRVGKGARRRCLTTVELSSRRMIKDRNGFWMRTSRIPTGAFKSRVIARTCRPISGDRSEVVPEGTQESELPKGE